MATLKESQRKIEPLQHAFLITPDDGAFLERKTRAIVFGGSAHEDIDFTFSGGERVTLTLAPGVVHRLEIIKVWAAGTTAVDIYGLY